MATNFDPTGRLRHIVALCMMLLFMSNLSAQSQINPNTPPNPTTKPGYNLIFADEFGSFNPGTWDISVPGNIGYAYGTPNFCNDPKDVNTRHAPKNASNVMPSMVVSDIAAGATATATVLPLRVREGEDMNACSHSGGEIKTFRGGAPEPNGFSDWYVYPNSYVEARVKVPKCNGVGASVWLWGPTTTNYNEIDLFETYGNDENSYQTNFHWGKQPNGREMDPERIDLEDLNENNVTLGDQFLIFGVSYGITGERSSTSTMCWSTRNIWAAMTTNLTLTAAQSGCTCY